MDYIQEQIAEIAKDIKSKGYRVFIAERGTYGFFTDKEGSRIISFQCESGVFSFSGNYKTNNPKSTGTGWRITEDLPYNYDQLFAACPPYWAIGQATWKYTTLDQHLSVYDKSSKYEEI